MKDLNNPDPANLTAIHIINWDGCLYKVIEIKRNTRNITGYFSIVLQISDGKEGKFSTSLGSFPVFQTWRNCECVLTKYYQQDVIDELLTT